ncbi:ATP-binding cassette domain-containing protein [Bacillus sp. FJAT-45037]|uniref:ATP-binding cassette domain-containing protein n=1 Tax=Bacillus sp. FJAT-45037 TaxID=2011007 RepID=UPI000C236CE0|nr:ABC transporter ATP-binding protein [Bacillus sp. FJAT-45037]
MSDVALQTNQLTKNYTDFTLGPLNISIPKGYITGFIGKNGAGKTTLFKEISAHFPKSDYVTYHELVKNVMYVSEKEQMYADFKVRDALELVASLYPEWDEMKQTSLLKKWSINEDTRIEQLSKGMAMKLNMIYALCSQPDVLLLDEPTSGLDPVARLQLLKECQEFMLNDERTVCMSSHISADLEDIADYLVFLKDGEIYLHGEKEQLKEDFKYFQAPPTTIFNHADVIGYVKSATGYTGVVMSHEQDNIEGALFRRPTLDEILYYVVEGGGIDEDINQT